MINVKGTFTPPYRPQSNHLCERMSQTIENIIKCTVRENWKMWDLSLPFVMMAYRATPQSFTGFTPNMLVTGRENNMPCDLIFGTPTSRGHIRNYSCYCVYVEDLGNNLVNAFFKTRQYLWDAARRQMYYDRTLPLIILRRVIGSSISINRLLCKPCLVVGQALSYWH